MAVSHVPTASGWMSLKRFGKVTHSVEPMVAWGDPLFDGKAVQKVAMAETGSTVRSVLNTRSAASLSTHTILHKGSIQIRHGVAFEVETLPPP